MAWTCSSTDAFTADPGALVSSSEQLVGLEIIEDAERLRLTTHEQGPDTIVDGVVPPYILYFFFIIKTWNHKSLFSTMLYDILLIQKINLLLLRIE